MADDLKYPRWCPRCAASTDAAYREERPTPAMAVIVRVECTQSRCRWALGEAPGGGIWVRPHVGAAWQPVEKTRKGRSA